MSYFRWTKYLVLEKYVLYNLLYRIPGILLFTDIIIKFNTGYYEEG